MKKTKTETELLQTIRKWEDLCNESLADAAYWKGQAQNVPDLLAALKLVYANAGESPEWIRARIGSVISKAEGVK